MSGFRLGFGVVSVLFGPSTREPVEVLADLGGAIEGLGRSLAPLAWGALGLGLDQALD